MSPALEPSKKYVLGLDLGSASLGWALIALDDTYNPTSLILAGVRIFEPGVDGTSMDIEQGKDQSKAVERRTARLHRRQLRRRAARQRDLFRLLQRHSLLPASETLSGSPEEQRHSILNELDQQLAHKWQPAYPGDRFTQLPLYYLRKRALDERLEAHEIGRILFHLIQRRGFLSNRKENKQNPEQKKELGQVKAEIHSLEQEIQNSGARTLGEFFAGLDPHAQKVRRRWTARRMFQDEFDKIWKAQAIYRPDLLTPELHDEIAHLLFFQRPIAAQTHLIGKCQLEPGKQRAPWAAMEAQRFRILQKVNDLRLINPGSLISDPLTEEERQRLYHLLDRDGDQTFKAIKKYLSFPAEVQINLEKGDEKRLRGNRTQAAMRKVFGDRWDTIGAGKQHQIVENWRNSESDEALIREAVEQWSLDDAAATLLSEQIPEPGYCAVSLTAISKMLPLMQCSKSFKEAETEAYGARFSGGVVFDILPEVRKQLESLRNPAVERALTELRKVVNAIVREYGKPYEIRIELARELKKPRQERIEATKKNRTHQREREEIAIKIQRECGRKDDPSRKDIEKALLYEECGGICPYTGIQIPFSTLFDNSEFDVEHIIPRSRYPDDSFQNKTLCYLPENRDVKKGQTPWEAYGKDEQRWAEIMTRVSSWKNRGKMARFAIQTEEALGEFSARQMNDTRYASVLAARFLGALYGGRDVVDGGKVRQVIFTSSGAVTATLRSSWGLEAILHEIVPAESGESRGKPRTDHRHHAIDAITIALTRPSVIQSMARAASMEPWQKDARAWRKIESPWKNFVPSIRPHIEQMLVSHRPEHKMSGELHKGTNYSAPYKYKGKSTVHTRCALSALSPADIADDEVIVDPAVRDAVRRKLEELGGNPKLFDRPENVPCLASRDGRLIPIRKVRIRETKNPLKVGQGIRERFVASGGIHHVALFVSRDERRREKWDSCVVQITEAYERCRRRLPVVLHELVDVTDAEFIFSMMKDDTIEVTDTNGTRILRVKKFGDNKQVWFVPVNDAHDDAQQKKLGITWSRTPNSLKELRPRKVVIDLLGKVHPAND
jgi:CRISPR-associated endonuclease Csn1